MFGSSNIPKVFKLDPQQISHTSIKVDIKLPFFSCVYMIGIHMFCEWGENVLIYSVSKHDFHSTFRETDKIDPLSVGICLPFRYPHNTTPFLTAELKGNSRS